MRHDDLLQLLAADRVEIHVGLLGRCQERRVPHGVVERLAQRAHALGRHVRRGEDRASDRGVAGDDLEDLPLLIVLRELGQQRRVRQIGFSRRGPTWNRMLTFLSLIQPGLLDLSDAQESLPRPSTSRRSSAIMMSPPPG